MMLKYLVHFAFCSISNSSGCFPSTAQVTLNMGKSITMSELEIGDKVKTGTCIGLNTLYYNMTVVSAK